MRTGIPHVAAHRLPEGSIVRRSSMRELIFAGLLAIAGAAHGQACGDATATGAADGTAAACAERDGYFNNWFARVREAQASQPHWITPLVTVTPRLEEEVRYDQLAQHLGNGATIDSYGGGKGLELIPTTTNEIILNAPPYLSRSNVKPAAGLGDAPFFLVKQRLLSANEQQGNYIVTAFLGIQANSGAAPFTNHAWLITPTIAAGKGFGNFDVQGTIGVSLPTAHQDTIGRAIATNIAFQYHLGEYFWPELEINDTAWSGGLRGGKSQLLITPGLILGRFALGAGTRGIVGVGYQYAVAPALVLEPAITPTYDFAWVFSGRVTF